MKKENEKDNWKSFDILSLARISSSCCSDDDPQLYGSYGLFDIDDDESNPLRNIDMLFAPILPRNQSHRRAMTQPTPPIPKNYNILRPKEKHVFKPRDNYFPKNDQFSINPHQLGFIPHVFWPDQTYQFDVLVHEFFQRKNQPNGRFSHKLYNALKLTESDNSYFAFTGVEWKSKDVIHVDKNIFARLLGINTANGSLFHQQGNFPSFGFVELTMEEIIKRFGDDVIKNNDIEVNRYLIHSPGVFVRNCSEKDIVDDIKWKGIRQRKSEKQF